MKFLNVGCFLKELSQERHPVVNRHNSFSVMCSNNLGFIDANTTGSLDESSKFVK